MGSKYLRRLKSMSRGTWSCTLCENLHHRRTQHWSLCTISIRYLSFEIKRSFYLKYCLKYLFSLYYHFFVLIIFINIIIIIIINIIITIIFVIIIIIIVIIIIFIIIIIIIIIRNRNWDSPDLM